MLEEYNAEMNKLVRIQKLLGQALMLENVPVDMDKINENEKENDLDNQHLLFERIVEQQQRVCSMYSIDESLPSFEQYNAEMSKLIQLQSRLNNCLSTSTDIEVIDDEEPIEKATRLFDNMVRQSKLV
jgi:cytochrome c